ncbi:MAG: amidase [Acidimicrobiales bacterium]
MADFDAGVWIERWPAPEGVGPLVAVKDLCDVVGSVTTAGCRALADRGVVATRDASCVSALRKAGARLVGKTNLHELAYGTSGENPWYGMPENPIDPGRVPGGSSSGSAVAVASGACDVAVGSDTGGSIRIPAACCGVVGLKTTWGRISLDGVWPLAPSFDTIGPMARDVAGAGAGLDLLEGRATSLSSFESEASRLPARVGRVRLGGAVEIDPVIETAIDDATKAASELSSLQVGEVAIGSWMAACKAHSCLLDSEAWASDASLLETEGVGDEVRARLEGASRRTPADVEAARLVRLSFSEEVCTLLERYEALVLPVLPWRPPRPEQWRAGFNVLAAPINFLGLPALALPVPVRPADRPPTGLQLVGPAGSEEMLLALGALFEEAAS